MDSMRRMNAYVKLNFQRCLSQGKTLVICICLAVFFYLYFGDVRGGLMESGQKIGIMEMFLVVTNNMYTSFTIWIGFVLIICDIPYRDDGVYQYLLRTSRRSWLWGQIVYIVAITVIYFAYIFLLLLLLIVPQVTFQTAWTTTFVKMINAPFGYGISNYFSFPVSVMRQTTALQLFGRMHCSLPDDWNGNWFSDYDASHAVAEWSRYCNRWNRNCDGLLGNGCASRSDK